MKKRLLNRGNLRDLIIILSLISSLFFTINLYIIIVAILLLIFGSLVHFVTKATLIRNEVLCREGIYSICRHPFYYSNFTIDISFCLLSGNIYLVMLYPFLFFGAYGPTLLEEEQMLLSIHKQDQYDYILEVPQVFPYKFLSSETLKKYISLSRISKNEILRIIRFYFIMLSLIFVHKYFYQIIRDFPNALNDSGTITYIAVLIIFVVAMVVMRFSVKKDRA